MIQFLADNIDQLDLALDQLAVSDRNFDRFAFMLVDNVVELTLHKFIQDKARENEMWTHLDKPKFDSKVIKKALGQNFDNKVKAAYKLDLIDEALCNSILCLHSFRNTSYHRGLRHEGILHSLAIFYFRNACILLKSYKPRYWSWSSSDVIPFRARKYLGNLKSLDHEAKFIDSYNRLDEIAASMNNNLIDDLTNDMRNTIDDMDYTLDFLSNDSPTKKSRDEAIIDAQAWTFAFTDKAKEYAKINGCTENTIGSYVEWLINNYMWNFKFDPIEGWYSRLNTLSTEKDNHKALKRYYDFMKQTEEIRSILNEASAQLDVYINQQIDMARGK
jgi:hypothetical protein